jgi:hypothetical protein
MYFNKVYNNFTEMCLNLQVKNIDILALISGNILNPICQLFWDVSMALKDILY